MEKRTAIRVLCIDGGGMRGIVPATFLDRLEKLSGKRISELFDVAVGTSTGSILAVGLNVPDKDNSAKYSAADFIKMYEDLGTTIFHENKSILKFLDGIARSTYDPSGFEKILNDYFADAEMSQLLSEVAVPSIELEEMKMHVFSKAKALDGQANDFLVRKVIRAATAAPTYFPAATVSSLDNSFSGTFVDAGVSTNNPSVLAFAETKTIHDDSPCVFVSLGTGAITKPIDAMKARKWGEIEWLSAIFNLQGEAQSSYTETTVQEILKGKANSSYYRLQVDLHQFPFDLADTKPEHLAELKQAASDYVNDNDSLFQELVEQLM